MAKKDAAFYFDLKNERRRVIVLPSNQRRVVFYRGMPDRNPIVDERDVLFLRGMSEQFVEVVKTKKEGWLQVSTIREREQAAVASRASIRQSEETAAASGENPKTASVPVRPATAAKPAEPSTAISSDKIKAPKKQKKKTKPKKKKA